MRTRKVLLVALLAKPHATLIAPEKKPPLRAGGDRSTSYDISAAGGKRGLIIAQAIFGPLRTHGAPRTWSGAACSPWLSHVLYIFLPFMLRGLLGSFLIPETARETLEELSGDDAYHRATPIPHAVTESPTDTQQESESREVVSVEPESKTWKEGAATVWGSDVNSLGPKDGRILDP